MKPLYANAWQHNLDAKATTITIKGTNVEGVCLAIRGYPPVANTP
jgi:hypothetical protein